MIKNVLLDLDDTILDFHKTERRALKETLRYMGLPEEPSILDRYSELNRLQWEKLERGEITREEVKVGRFQLLFHELGTGKSAEQATSYYENRLCYGCDFIDGAQEMLEKLFPKYRLYLASNGTAKVQHSRLAIGRLEPYFSALFISEEMGCDKPSREYFDCCFRLIPGFLPEETAILGDSLTSDIRGGVQAGIRTVWFNPKGRENLSAYHPDCQIQKLSQAEAALEKLSEN